VVTGGLEGKCPVPLRFDHPFTFTLFHFLPCQLETGVASIFAAGVPSEVMSFWGLAC